MHRAGLLLLLTALLGAGSASGQSTNSGASMAEAAAFRDNKEFDRAVLAYESIVRSQPNNGEAWYLLGYTLHEMREFDRAIYAFDKAAEFPQFRGAAVYNQGCAYALTGRKDDAFAALRRALDAGFVDRAQFDGDVELAELRSDPRWNRLFGIDEEGRNHELDFLIGRWMLLGATGPIGWSTVERRQNGFLIYEEVSLNSGVTADRFYYYDARDHAWRMTSVDGRGGTVRARGRYADNAMTFEGGRVNPDSTELRCRITLAPAQNGSVLYSQEVSSERDDYRPVLQARYVHRRRSDRAPDSGPASAPVAEVRPGLSTLAENGRSDGQRRDAEPRADGDDDEPAPASAPAADDHP